MIRVNPTPFVLSTTQAVDRFADLLAEVAKLRDVKGALPAGFAIVLEGAEFPNGRLATGRGAVSEMFNYPSVIDLTIASADAPFGQHSMRVSFNGATGEGGRSMPLVPGEYSVWGGGPSAAVTVKSQSVFGDTTTWVDESGTWRSKGRWQIREIARDSDGGLKKLVVTFAEEQYRRGLIRGVLVYERPVRPGDVQGVLASRDLAEQQRLARDEVKAMLSDEDGTNGGEVRQLLDRAEQAPPEMAASLLRDYYALARPKVYPKSNVDNVYRAMSAFAKPAPGCADIATARELLATLETVNARNGVGQAELLILNCDPRQKFHAWRREMIATLGAFIQGHPGFAGTPQLEAEMASLIVSIAAWGETQAASEAITLCTKLLTKPLPDEVAAEVLFHRGRAALYSAPQDYAAAKRDFERALSLNPEAPLAEQLKDMIAKIDASPSP